MTIIIKTNMVEIPTNCKECFYHLKSIFTSDIGCPFIKEWLNVEEWRKGKVKLDNCPLEEQKNETN